MMTVPLSALDGLGFAIRQWRATAQLSQAELGVRIGTSQAAISRWEHGHEEPRLSTIAAILRACELDGELRIGEGVDRAQIKQQLTLTARQRLDGLTNVARLARTAQRSR